MSTQELERGTEAEKVISHRLSQFLLLGCDLDDAQALALMTHVDHHDVEALLAKGCPLSTALRIYA